MPWNILPFILITFIFLHYKNFLILLPLAVLPEDAFLFFNLAHCLYLVVLLNFLAFILIAARFLLYAIFLQRSNKLQIAKSQYEKAIKINSTDLQLFYNYGLLLVELKEYDKAKEIANSVYSKKFPLPGLKGKLKEAGYWP